MWNRSTSCQGNSVSEGCSITKSEWLVPTHLAGSDESLTAWKKCLEASNIKRHVKNCQKTCQNRKIWKVRQFDSHRRTSRYSCRNSCRKQSMRSMESSLIQDASIKHQAIDVAPVNVAPCPAIPRLFGIILTSASRCWCWCCWFSSFSGFGDQPVTIRDATCEQCEQCEQCGAPSCSH